MQDVAGKVAVVTGAASGIGFGMASRFAQAGMRVVLADVEQPVLDAAVERLTQAGFEVLGVPTDVSKVESVEALAQRTLERFGGVHVLCNNAGVGGGFRRIWEASLNDWTWSLGVNLWGVIHGIRAFVPLLVAQGEGHVVNTASLAGLVSTAFMGPYNATKHAVVTISETLAKDLRAVGSPVGVSVLCPGFVRTSIDRSDRNRPVWAPAPEEAPGYELLQQAIQQLVAGGIDPAGVADQVIDAVRNDTFYILTHEESTPAVATRMHDILEGRAPSDTAIP
jgi:NAD(P)-dependent dehydrogenase (short-subunit alcohol dehydrogenase family)